DTLTKVETVSHIADGFPHNERTEAVIREQTSACAMQDLSANLGCQPTHAPPHMTRTHVRLWCGKAPRSSGNRTPPEHGSTVTPCPAAQTYTDAPRSTQKGRSTKEKSPAPSWRATHTNSPATSTPLWKIEACAKRAGRRSSTTRPCR